MSSRIFDSLLALFFPETCPVCRTDIAGSGMPLCVRCLAGMPLIPYYPGAVNPAEDLFAAVPIVSKAASMFSYRAESPYAEIIKDIKYRRRPHIGQQLAELFAHDLAEKGFFDGIDCIVPVPLHYGKLQKRGYNQSLYIARGFSDATGIPVGELLKAPHPHATQTRQSPEERRRNVSGVFEAVERLDGKTVLLVDDVITTGATAEACCRCLADAGATAVVVASLGLARHRPLW